MCTVDYLMDIFTFSLTNNLSSVHMAHVFMYVGYLYVYVYTYVHTHNNRQL